MAYKDPDIKREYQRIWYRQRRSAEFVGRKCEYCPATEKLRYKHIDGKPKVSIQGHCSWTEKRRTEVLKNYIIICPNCLAKRKKS